MANPYSYYPASYYNPYAQSWQMQVPQQSFAPALTNTVPQQSIQPAQPTQSGIVWISGGDQEALAYPVAPNNAVTLWSQTEPVVYLKQADASGRASMKVYDLVERSTAAHDKKDEPDRPAIDFATKEDLATLASIVKSVDSTLSGVRSDVDAMKGDMYGIAGKKKSAKKQEEVDD